jgi:hypothetical protein
MGGRSIYAKEVTDLTEPPIADAMQ